ncbi:MAG: MATE family efflux transporter [Bacillota bacterium]|jgi:putative MATE family efflux protein|nr:MATE family efflux transporter [Bacillota bacterium]MDI9416063.1 MATE family efflux transporter [Bacillota bacterium]NLD12505.1 MATE family efflux transporter [Bacillota bacterium]HCD41647.1 MATE family efflux transporter [Bacillota bacterium]HOB88897.1 MATE family efflux transporter [Bacillota bacterium]
MAKQYDRDTKTGLCILRQMKVFVKVGDASNLGDEETMSDINTVYAREFSDPELDREVLKLAWPAIVENILHTFIWVVDTAMVGHLGAQALSAVGLSGSVYWNLVWVFSAVAVGAMAVVARSVGAGDTGRAAHAAGQALLISILLGIIFTVGTHLSAPLVFRLGGFEDEVSAMGIGYLRIVGAGSVMLVLTKVGAGILRGAGDTRTPMFVSFVTNTINAIGDYVLIFGVLGFPRLGVTGAAIATLFANVVGGILTLVALFQGRSMLSMKIRKLFAIDMNTVKTLVTLSIPAALEETLTSTARILSSFMIASLGTVAFAAHQVTIAAESLSFMPGLGFATASGVLVGQNLGAKKADRARLVTYRAIRYAVMTMGGFAVLFFAVPHIIVSFFTAETEVMLLAATCLRIAGLEQVFIGIADTFRGSLRGAGDTRSALKMTAIGTWVVRIPVIAFIVYVLRLSLAAVWVGICIEWVVRAIVGRIYFSKGNWERIEIR